MTYDGVTANVQWDTPAHMAAASGRHPTQIKPYAWPGSLTLTALLASLHLRHPLANLRALKVSGCLHRWWITWIREHEVHVVADIGNGDGEQRARDVACDATTAPGIKAAIRPYDIASSFEPPPTVIDRRPLRPGRDAPLSPTSSCDASEIKRLLEKHVRHAVASHRLQHLGAVKVVPEVSVLRRGSVGGCTNAVARLGQAVIVEDPDPAHQRLNELGVTCGTALRQGGIDTSAHLPDRVGREHAVAIEDIG
mmetsp:Transcript_40510/g.91857  ORF Transcript_40510/g.91857 Transcript_40510/m.91857 type:complete len:252 (-) Transcript_40510:97-852(-)